MTVKSDQPEWAAGQVTTIAHMLMSHYGTAYALGEVSSGVGRLIADLRRAQQMVDSVAKGQVYVPAGHILITFPDQTYCEVPVKQS